MSADPPASPQAQRDQLCQIDDGTTRADLCVLVQVRIERMFPSEDLQNG